MNLRRGKVYVRLIPASNTIGNTPRDEDADDFVTIAGSDRDRYKAGHPLSSGKHLFILFNVSGVRKRKIP